MINPYALMDVFTDHEAAFAVANLVAATTPEETARVILFRRQIQRDIASGKLPSTVTETQHYRKEPPHPSAWKLCNSPYDDPSYRQPVPSHISRVFHIARADLLAWCEQSGIRPALLFPEPLPVEKTLHATERQTLLAIIRALAELNGIKSTSDAYRKEAGALLAELASKGIRSPCNDKTLAKHLTAAFKSR
ncbi:MAG TPA: hypothetical protein PLD30_12325 [Candidatus Competibacteraceae bacterium]|nr:hypothetical protein [Candidatus Competibacteraceae bacterium]